MITKRKLPHFKSAEEEARFWEKHSLTDYLGELEEVTDLFVLAPSLARRIRERARKRLISIRLANWEIEKCKQLAKRKRVPYQSLMRDWIDAGLRKESLALAR